MDGSKFILYNMLFFVISKMVDGRVHNFRFDSNLRKSKEYFAVIPGIKMYYNNGEIGVEFSLRDFISDNVVEGRAGGGGGGGSGGGGGGGKRTGPLQRIIRTMMILPFAMQILSLPGALAEIKISLLRSLMVAKMALIMLIFNTFRNSQKEIVVVQKVVAPQHYDHYYNPYPETEEKNQGWLGSIFGR